MTSSTDRLARPGHRPRLGVRLAHAVVVFGLLLPPPVRAESVSDETRNAAREIGKAGVSAYESGDYARAADLLQQAYSLVPAPTIGLYRARALAKLGRLVEAVERYELVARMQLDAAATPAFREAVAAATTEVEEVTPRIPRVRLKLSGPSADSPSLVLRLDGKPYPKQLLGVEGPVDPGEHVIVAEVPGVSRAEEHVTFEERKHYVVSLRLVQVASNDAAPVTRASEMSSSGSSQKTWGWVSLGAGGAGLLTGAVAALLARDKKADLDAQCPGGTCPESARSDRDEMRRLSTFSLVGYGVGVVGIGVGSVLLLTAPSARQSSARLDAWVGPGSAGVKGAF